MGGQNWRLEKKNPVKDNGTPPSYHHPRDQRATQQERRKGKKKIRQMEGNRRKRKKVFSGETVEFQKLGLAGSLSLTPPIKAAQKPKTNKKLVTKRR